MTRRPPRSTRTVPIFPHTPLVRSLLPGAAQHFQPEADVLSYRQVGEQRVALEHRVERSLERRQAAQRAALQEDLAAARLFETADQPQQRGLAAARGAQ